MADRQATEVIAVASPIEARCDRCGEVFALFELREDRTGNCPRCGRQLAPEWTAKLLHDAVRADVALGQLVASLKSLRAMPTAMRVLPSSVLRPLFEETRWREQLAEVPALAELELRELRRLVSDYERALPSPASSAVATRRRRRRKLAAVPRRAAVTGRARHAA